MNRLVSLLMVAIALLVAWALVGCDLQQAAPPSGLTHAGGSPFLPHRPIGWSALTMLGITLVVGIVQLVTNRRPEYHWYWGLGMMFCVLAVVTPIAAALMHKPTEFSRFELGAMFVLGVVLLLIKRVRVPVRKAKS